MSENTLNKPVFLDATAQEILGAVKSLALREGASREVLEEIKTVLQEIAAKTGTTSTTESVQDIFLVPMTTTVTANDDFGLPKSVSCTIGNVTIEEIEEAYNAGKMLFADTTDTDSGNRYFIPLSSVEVSAANTSWCFASESKKNPLGRPSIVTVRKITSTGALYLSCSPSQVRSEFVQCSIDIGGTTYTTVTDALNALAALHTSE